MGFSMFKNKTTIFSDMYKKTPLKGVIGKKSVKWFNNAAKNISINNPSEFIKNELDMKYFKRNKIMPGYMYMFIYDAKWKDTLPFWDAFPLVFPWRILPDGFIGINLHYLPPADRAALMDKLYSITNNTRYNDNTKLKLSYKELQRVANSRMYEPCIHRYLNTCVKSKFFKIPSDYWNIALFLPVEDFRKTDKKNVWGKSKSIYG